MVTARPLGPPKNPPPAVLTTITIPIITPRRTPSRPRALATPSCSFPSWSGSPLSSVSSRSRFPLRQLSWTLIFHFGGPLQSRRSSAWRSRRLQGRGDPEADGVERCGREARSG